MSTPNMDGPAFATRMVTMGVKNKNHLSHISSGIISLDYVLGGGLPCGNIFIVEEDIMGTYGKVLLKHFIAEGIASKQGIFIASADENPYDIIKEIPQPCTVEAEDEVQEVVTGVDKMKIAWRYEGLSKVESEFGKSSGFAHYFDLSKHVDCETIENSDIEYWTPPECEPTIYRIMGTNNFSNKRYGKLLDDIVVAISENSMRGKPVMRVAIQSLGSPYWKAMYNEDDTYNSYMFGDLISFMYMLKTLIEHKNAVVYITIPSRFIDDNRLIRRLLYTACNAVKLESFVDTYRRSNPVYKDYHGLFHVTKLTTPNSTIHHIPPSNDMAFKLKRKKFIIEKLHLPPELEETKEREQDDITAMPKNVNCGTFHTRNIDF